MAAHVDITYEDGRTDHVAVLPIAALFAERRYGKDAPPIESALYGVWCLLQKPCESFDAWAATITDWQERVEGSDAPLPEGPPPGQ